MKLNYNFMLEGIFIKRLNRFNSIVNVDGRLFTAHIHDLGRLSELLHRGVKVLLRKHNNPNAKTNFYLFAVKADSCWVLVDSALHNRIIMHALNENLLEDFKVFKFFRREVSFNKCRIDFLLKSDNDRLLLLEVKGCTLVKDGVAIFPDAPTLRGLKHLKCLVNSMRIGCEAAIIFLITHQAAEEFAPNWSTDPNFSRMLVKAYNSGLKIYPYKFILNVENLSINYVAKLPFSFKFS